MTTLYSAANVIQGIANCRALQPFAMYRDDWMGPYDAPWRTLWMGPPCWMPHG